MGRHVQLMLCTSLVLLTQFTDGNIVTSTSRCLRSRLSEENSSGTLTYSGSSGLFCRWDIEKPVDDGAALVFYVKEVSFTNNGATIVLPGVPSATTRTEPYCYAYTTAKSYCDQNDVLQQAQESYSECEAVQVYPGMKVLKISFSPTGQQASFTIEYKKITCKEPISTTMPSQKETTSADMETSKAYGADKTTKSITVPKPASTERNFSFTTATGQHLESVTTGSKQVHSTSKTTESTSELTPTSGITLGSATKEISKEGPQEKGKPFPGTTFGPRRSNETTDDVLAGYDPNSRKTNLIIGLVVAFIVIIITATLLVILLRRRYNKKQEKAVISDEDPNGYNGTTA